MRSEQRRRRRKIRGDGKEKDGCRHIDAHADMRTHTCARTHPLTGGGGRKKEGKGRGRREGEIVREMSPLGETEGVGRERGERAE